MIEYPLDLKFQDPPRILIYYSELHDDFVERLLIAAVSQSGQPLLIDVNERIIDSTYVYLGEL